MNINEFINTCPAMLKQDLECNKIQLRWNKDKELKFDYVNWKGERSIRRVKPLELWEGNTDFHKEKQWLLRAWDLEKDAERNFAVNDIIEFVE